MVDFLIKYRNKKFLSKIIRVILIFLGVDIPCSAIIGKKVNFPHNSFGTVIHPNTEIGNSVRIYQNVTIGRADIYKDYAESNMRKIIINEGSILCAGCKVLSKDERLTIGRNNIIAANAVLLQSTGDNEIWGGIPARKIGNVDFNSGRYIND